MATQLAEDPVQAADTNLQGQLLQFLGPLQDMLNDEWRRGLFSRLPFVLLQVLMPWLQRCLAVLTCAAHATGSC